jgi:DNA-directed RNA polymerase subunit beta
LFDLVDKTGEDCRSWQENHATCRQSPDEGNVKDLLVPYEQILAPVAANDIINEETGAIYVEAGDELTLEMDKAGDVIGGTLKELVDAGIKTIPFWTSTTSMSAPTCNVQAADKTCTRNRAYGHLPRHASG